MTLLDVVETQRHKILALERSLAVIEFNLDGIVLRANDAFLKMMNYDRSGLVGKHHSIFALPGKQHEEELQELWSRLRRGEHTVGEFCRKDRGGQPVWIHGVYCPLIDEDGTPYRIMKFASDITVKKRHDADFAGQIAAIRISQAVAEFDLQGHLIDANQNFLQIFGYSLEDIIGRHHSVFVDETERLSPAYRQFWKHLASGAFHKGLYRRIDVQGLTHWIQASYNPVRDELGKLTKIVKFATDQTEAVEDHRRVEYLSRHDPLTGLANRTGLHTAVECARAGDVGSSLTMLVLDLDRFKEINDAFGHATGDACLKVVAGRIRDVARGAVSVARLGGDEFAIVLSDRIDADSLAREIIRVTRIPIACGNEKHQVGASIGIGCGSEDDAELLRRADIALYVAKAAGGDTYRQFETNMDPIVRPLVSAPGLVPVESSHQETISAPGERRRWRR